MSTRLRAYADLFRLSNGPTTIADVWAGMLIALSVTIAIGLKPAEVVGAVLITLASCLLYFAGMVLNDVFDAEEDAVLRPTRPIPRGDISWRTAGGVGWGMLTAGIATASAGGLCFQTRLPGLVAMTLAACVVAYDAGLKKTPMGPVAMGACRGLNVLLGMAVAFNNVDTGVALIGFAGPTLYIAGVTLFARSEEVHSDRRNLIAAALVSLSGLAVLGGGIWLTSHDVLHVTALGWALLWAVVALHAGRRFVAAILQPSPRRVQGAVGVGLQSIILIDTTLACGFAGTFWGLVVLALLPPTMLISRFIPQT